MIFHLINFNGYLGPGDNTTYANLARNIARGEGIAHNTASIPEVIGHVGFPDKDSDKLKHSIRRSIQSLCSKNSITRIGQGQYSSES